MMGMRFGFLPILPLAITLAACDAPQVRMDDPTAQTYLRLLMPAKLEIQHFTRPVSLHGDGKADGLEVMVATLDSFGDQIKSVGSFNIELYQERKASADQFGKRVAYWSVKIDSEQVLKENWDGLARVYVFRLRLPMESLPAERYVLTAQLNLPGDVRLFDEHQFDYAGGVAPNVTPLAH